METWPAIFYATERLTAMVNQHSDNLKKPRSTDEARQWGAAGGVASGESRRKKKALTEAFRAILDGKLPDDLAKQYGFEKDTETAVALVLTTMRQALDGNLKAVELIRDTAGEKPVTEVESKVDMGVSDADRKLLEKVQARLNESHR